MKFNGNIAYSNIVLGHELSQRVDYWKSQDRKYCEFCKCWIADNKPSVQFHENGKRHKEAVAKRLSQMSKKSAKQHKANLKLEAEMKKMEEAAMKAYMNDIEQNPDYSSQQVLQELIDRDPGKSLPSELEIIEACSGIPKPPPKKKWHEAKTDDGTTYFWNIETNESVWEPPSGGFVSWDELQKRKGVSGKIQEEKDKMMEEEMRAYKAREEMKLKYRKEESKPEEVVIPEAFAPILEPTPRAGPYGGWTVVQPSTKKINLQLPKTEVVEINVPHVSEPRHRIKEKKIEHLDSHSDVPTTFKKRKVNVNRGIRKKIGEGDDD